MVGAMEQATTDLAKNYSVEQSETVIPALEKYYWWRIRKRLFFVCDTVHHDIVVRQKSLLIQTTNIKIIMKFVEHHDTICKNEKRDCVLRHVRRDVQKENSTASGWWQDLSSRIQVNQLFWKTFVWSKIVQTMRNKRNGASSPHAVGCW